MKPIIFILLVLLATSLMGSSFTFGKMGLDYASPLLLAGIRFTLAGLLMAFWVRNKKHPASAIAWLKVATIGLFQTALVMGCIFLSLRTITAGESAILTFINPLLVIIFGTIVFRTRYRLSQWAGVVIGFVGVTVTLGFQMQLQTGTWLGLGSAVCWAIATLLVKQWAGEMNIWVLTAYQMLCGGIVLVVLGLFIEAPHLVINMQSVGIILYLAVLGSIVQFAVWYYLLQQGEPGRTSAFLFLAPFFGVLSGWLLLGEVVYTNVYRGGGLILVGIFLANWRPGKLRDTAS
ncbi:DMT family transporter [Paenibacillus sp. P96]|uniref:DMT family transporter n=1 Tax=Paenibacillus zeirhizosphaerae TaxID=2987519 RepID=A0ABT9FLY7_9BACL|nr:DMT family transporter [Paenibacillus sp. P96]MDP4095397.1 DMT family transporter [Paenibacillus sp. P96]